MKNNNVDGVGAEQIHEIGNFMDKWGNLPEMQEDLYSLLSSHTDSIEAKYENCPQCTGLREEYKKELVWMLRGMKERINYRTPRSTNFYKHTKGFNAGLDAAINLINNNQK